jgi:tetratricopeptide (TPR) repeat protein
LKLLTICLKETIMKSSIATFAFITALAAAIPAQGAEQLGKVNFPTSCDPKLQAQFERGLAMLHSFWYSAAEKTFREVADQDPSCAIARWGFASIIMANPLAGQGAAPKRAPLAQEAIEQARKIGAKTQRERDYIEAVAAYYENFANRTETDRQLTRAKAYETLAARYPNDDEAQIFYALYLAGTQAQTDQTYAAYLKAAGILEKQFAKYPDHPGVAHYLIHSYDAAPIADKGLPAARRYASIAPAAPHALHMPSHIFTRVGEWADAAATNKRSAEVALAGNDTMEALHASDYMVYAYLQMARDTDAKKVLDEGKSLSGLNPAVQAGYYAQAAMPARYAIERGNWSEAKNLQPGDSKFPWVQALTHYARALGAARSGDPAAAEKDVQQLASLRDSLKAAKNSYWATEVEVNRLGAAAWVALAQGKKDEALKLMRAAADTEDKSEKHIVTPGRILPARELLGEMLLELKQPALALKEFEASQVREPNRFRGLYGAALAAESAGDRQKAGNFFAKLVAMTKDSDTARPELRRAKAYLAAR